LAFVLAGVFWSDTGDNVARAVAAIPSDTQAGAVDAPLATIDEPHETAALTLPAADVDDEAAGSQPSTVEETTADDLAWVLQAGAGATAEKRVALSRLSSDYRALRRLAALSDLPRLRDEPAVTGIASTYNPYRDGPMEGGALTASGEFYDPTAWTAAIQTDLRAQFGGVRYGRLYRQTYVLVECGDKQAIVRINDVGPLKPGRIIDLNERAMRYFDPFLRRGLLADVRVTLLPGEDWMPGPVGTAQVVRTAGNL
jgi:rare lipoprotein A